MADDLARAIPVRPVGPGTAWYSGMKDATTSTVTMPATVVSDRARLNFALWYDTEPDSDVLTLQRSDDGGATWTTVPFTLTDGRQRYQSSGAVSGYDGHRWYLATATLASHRPVRRSSAPSRGRFSTRSGG